MDFQPPNTTEKILIVIALILTLIMGWAALHQDSTENPSGGLLDANYAIISGNSLKAYVMPAQLRITVLSNKIIQCESGWDNSAIGKAGEIGLAQFKKSTWDWMTGLADYEGNIENRHDQIYMLNFALENGLMCHWTCYHHLYPGECR